MLGNKGCLLIDYRRTEELEPEVHMTFLNDGFPAKETKGGKGVSGSV